MRGNHFGKLFSFMSFGESHGPALGVVIDGVPSNLTFSLEALQVELDRRAPGRLKGTTSRSEKDQAEVLSGVFEGKTLGTPIAVVVRNHDQRSEDYRSLRETYRPGHADETTQKKFGIRDHRGGGRSSGRETLARVIAGYFARLICPDIQVQGFIKKLGPFTYDQMPKEIFSELNPYSFPRLEKTQEMETYLLDLKKRGESRGGEVALLIKGVPAGLGEPVFDKLKADLAKALMSVGAVVGFSFGWGTKMADLDGSEVSKQREAFGGIEGGITNGEDIALTVTFKPTSTVGEKAQAGRHDPCIMPRAIPVLEAMVYCVLADHLLRQRAYER